MNSKVKEYNKLTVEQFKQLIAKLPELRYQKAEFESVVKAAPKRLDELLERDFAWASVYETRVSRDHGRVPTHGKRPRMSPLPGVNIRSNGCRLILRPLDWRIAYRHPPYG
jgi:hypothetical protein